MKLKPLIKTHWVASQNPMTVSLSGLQRVVFSPPNQVLNAEFFGDPKEQVQLPPRSAIQMLPPNEEEDREIRARSHTLARDIFWTLFSGHDLKSLRAPARALNILAESLEFHFDDGQCYSLIGIFRKTDFPLFLNPKFYLQDRSTNWDRALENPNADFMKPLKLLEYQKRQEDFKKSWVVILEILAWALQRKRQVGDLEVVWADHRNERVGFHIEDIEFHKAHPLAATVKSVPIVRNTARITVWQGLETNAPTGILRFHAIGHMGEMESQSPDQIEIAPDELETLNSRAKPLMWQPVFATTESGPKEILRTLTKLNVTVGEENIYFAGHTEVSGTMFKPMLKVRESEGTMQMSASFSIEPMKLLQVNFPSPILTLLTPFRGGMDVFFGFDRKDFASRQMQYRTNDLLLLRHQGLALFTLLELINWKLGRPLSSGETIEFVNDLALPEADRQFNVFYKYLKGSIPGLLGKSGSSFEEMFSTEVKHLYFDFLEKLFGFLQNDRTLVFQGNQVAEIKNVHAQVLPFIRFIILHLVEASGGKVLTRAQSAMAESFLLTLTSSTDAKFVSTDTATTIEPTWIDLGPYNKYIVALLFDLTDHGVDVEFNGAPFMSLDNPFEFIFSVNESEGKEDGNWFDLHPQIFFNGTRIDSEEVQLNFTPDRIGFIEYRGQMYRIDKKQIPTLKSLQRFWNRIKSDRQSTKRNSFGEKVYQLERSHALELLMLQSQGVQVQGEGEWKRIFEYFEKGLGVEKIHLPESMQKQLLPHQRDGAQWLHDLYELRLGAILADEMGLGKTFQVLSFLTSLQDQQKLNKCLIVVPTSLVYNWVDEKKKFSPDLPLHVFHSNEQQEVRDLLAKDDPLVLIATYGLLTENPDFFQSFNWNVLAFDEAQNLKNITSLRSVSARKLKAQFKVCLTGTPMENNYLEFFSLCDLVVPGCLGDVDAFRKKYYNREVRIESIHELRLVSRPLLLRRTKQQVKLSLPIKTIQKVLLPFSGKQRDIYKRMAMTFSKQVEDLIHEQGERKAQIAMFAALMRLRQICSDPAAVPGVIYDEQPVKVEHFLGALTEHLENGESVIVFTQFLSTLGRIGKELEKLKVPTFTLQGKVSSKERLRLISAFQDSPEPGVMLMTLKTGGVGLNLTKASVVYHLEPWWNPAVENQATDRAHRMGQTKDVKVYNLLIEGSLEERIADLKLRKQGSFDRLFSVDEQIEEGVFEGSSGLSKEDFVYLLK
ncbi:MAG: DEAD/DEAH box helicase [Bdellovibrionota bacterium]